MSPEASLRSASSATRRPWRTGAIRLSIVEFRPLDVTGSSLITGCEWPRWLGTTGHLSAPTRPWIVGLFIKVPLGRIGVFTMDDLTIYLDDCPGTLATMGEALGAAGVSIEGGAMFVEGGRAVAHFLFSDGEAARVALDVAGIEVGACHETLVQRLDQE